MVEKSQKKDQGLFFLFVISELAWGCAWAAALQFTRAGRYLANRRIYEQAVHCPSHFAIRRWKRKSSLSVDRQRAGDYLMRVLVRFKTRRLIIQGYMRAGSFGS